MDTGSLRSNIVTAFLILCAAAITISIVHREFFSKTQSAERDKKEIQLSKGTRLSDSQIATLLSGRKPLLGDPSAAVTIIEFSDFECPYCREMDDTLAQIYKIFGGRVSVYRFDYPLSDIHSHAQLAARVSRCGQVQGKGWLFQHEIFKVGAKISNVDWVEFARNQGVVDIDEFSHCISSENMDDEILADRAAGDMIGVQWTPSIYINGSLVEGKQGTDDLKAMIYSEIESM